MGKTNTRAAASTTFENPLDGNITFDADDNMAMPDSPPELAIPPQSPMRVAPKKRAMTECDQLLSGQEGGMETDWFDFFCSALTKIAAQWDPAAELFKQLDDDGSGELGHTEVRTALRERLSDKQIRQAFTEMDADGGGSIDIAEFRDWWEKRVISPSGSFHSALGQMSREQTKQEMQKCFETSDLPSGELSAFISLGAKFDTPMDARDFWDSVELHVGVQLSPLDRQQLANELFSERPKTSTGEVDHAETFTVREFLAWWQEFFEFDAIDPYAAAMQVLAGTKGLINPFSKFRGDWDLVQTFMLFYIMMAVPYRSGFDDSVEPWSFWFWLDVMIDGYFIADVVINFRTAVIMSDGRVLFRQKDIALNYAKTWLAVDVSSCLPLGYIAMLLEGTSSDSSNRSLRLLRLIRLLRLLRMPRIFERWEEMLYGAQWFKALKVVVSLLGCAHWLACMWYYCGQDELPTGTTEQLAGAYESKGWVVTKYVDWTNYTAVTMSDRYFDSFFWGMSTSLMVSSSDDPMSPTTKPEKIIFLVSFFAGAILFSFIIGTVSDLIAHSNPGVTARNDAVGVINNFLSERGVKPALLRRARSHVKTLFAERGTNLEIADCLRLFPYHVQVELGVQLRFIDDPETSRRSAFARVPFFKSLGNTELLAIGCMLKHVRYMKPETVDHGTVDRSAYIMQEGDRGVEMWIVSEGVVSVESGTGRETVDLGKLREGDYFGEMGVLCQERPGVPLRRGRSAFAHTDVLLYSLHYDDLKLLRQAHPQIDAAVHTTVTKLRNSQPDLFFDDAQVKAAQLATSTADIMEMREEIAELRETMTAGFESVRTQIAALSK